MRILHVYKDYDPIVGGIENHVKTVAEAQARSGHEVRVLVTRPGRVHTSHPLPHQELINGVHVIRAWRLATVASTPLSPVFPFQLWRTPADIVHLHFPYPVGEVSQWLAGRGRPYVITYHSDVVKQKAMLRFYRPLMKRVLNNASRILPTSDRYVQSSKFLRPLAGKCSVVPLSVEPDVFVGNEPLLPPAGKPTLLFVGQHRYYKGVDTLIRALPDLDVRLIIGGDGPMRQEWEGLIDVLGVRQKVVFTGRVSDADLPKLYASADIFVLPANARSEAFGKVLLEAMASGLPCITTEVGTGTSFVVQNGVTGLVVPPKDPPALAKAVQRLLDDVDLRRAMGCSGRERVMSEFTPQKMLARIDAVYEAVLV